MNKAKYIIDKLKNDDDYFLKTARRNLPTLKNFQNKFLSGVALGASVILTTKIVDEILDFLDDIRDKYRYRKYFTVMLENNPQLKDVDPALIAKYWNSLRIHAPSMLEDPLASGAFITQAIKRTSSTEFGGPPPETFVQLSQLEKNTGSRKKVDVGGVFNDYIAKFF